MPDDRCLTACLNLLTITGSCLLCLYGGWGDGQHLQAFPAVGIGALVDALDEVVVHHRLNVRARQRQDVAQALVPGMELPQAAGVLIQALRQREQQPASAVPVCTTHSRSAISSLDPVHLTTGMMYLLVKIYVTPYILLVQPCTLVSTAS